MPIDAKKDTVLLKLPPIRRTPQQEFRRLAHRYIRMGIPASQITIIRGHDREGEEILARIFSQREQRKQPNKI